MKTSGTFGPSVPYSSTQKSQSRQLFETGAAVAGEAIDGNGRPTMCPGCGIYVLMHGQHRGDCTASNQAVHR
jgi:hypothetical protein